jgi:predicted  nucleic acid-binding Zn-ribbon protein
MKSNSTNSISNNLTKLRKYQERLSGSTNQQKNTVYNQKIRFYQEALRGAGLSNNSLNATNGGSVNQPAGQSGNVDSLISKIDALIQKSKSTRSRVGGRSMQSGGSVANKVSGHRIMTSGMRQRGGAPEDRRQVLDALNVADFGQVDGSNVMDAQATTVDAIREKIRSITGTSGDKSAKIVELQDLVATLRSRITALETGQDAATAAAGEAGEQIADLTERLRVADEALAEAQAENNALRRRIAELEDELAALERELNLLRARVGADEGTETIEELKAQIAALQAQIEELRAAKAAADEQVAEHEVTIARLEAENAGLRAEIERLGAEAGEAGEAGEAIRKELADLTALYEEALVMLRELDAQNKELVANLATVDEALGELHDAQLKHNDVPDVLAYEGVGTAQGDLAGGATNLDRLLQMSVQVPAGF